MTIIGTGVSVSNDPLSLLEIITRFCERTGLRAPTTVMGNADTQIVQLRALLEEEVRSLSTRGNWESLVYEATFTTVANEDQGLITDMATYNFRWIKDETIWDRSTRLPVFGPMTGREWQARKALNRTGSRYRYRIRGGHVLVSPTPTAGLTWAFEYVTKNVILNAAGDGLEYYQTDNDEAQLPGDLLLMGLRWRWKKEKGLDYTQDFQDYEFAVSDQLGHDGGKVTLSQDDSSMRDPRPTIFVPYGTWQVTAGN